MKKIRRRNAMSASDEEGTSDDAFEFFWNPPPLIAMV
jgi:hypothetical protein